METTGFNNLFNIDDIEYLQNQILKKTNLDIAPYDVGVLLYRYRNEGDIIDNAYKYTLDQKLIDWYAGKRILADTKRFREEAIKFEKQGYYCDAPRPVNMRSKYAKESEYYKYWNEQARRCVKGYHVGDDWVTGYHYYYLNFAQIEKVRKVKHGNKFISERSVFQPDFWDGDYYFFHYIEEARRKNKHALCLKKRGAGLSWKFASMLARNLQLIPDSRSIVYANDEGYLIEDGVLDPKTWMIANFTNEHTAWSKRRLRDTRTHKQTGYKIKRDDGQELTKGFGSEVIGRTMGHDVHKSRGKRSMLIGFEEFGSQDNGDTLWEVTTPSVEQGVGDKKEVFGMKLAYGTGGEEGASFKAMRTMIYQPDDYDILSVPNLWDKGSYGERVGYFWPITVNESGYMDEHGNSNIAAATKAIEELHQSWIDNRLDGATIAKRKAENPLTIQDAILDTSGSPFPIVDLRQQKAKIESDKKLLHAGTAGTLVLIENTVVEFKPDVEGLLQPIISFKSRPSSTEGAVVRYHKPAVLGRTGEIPINRYAIGVDPIDFDKSEVGKEFSYGAAYVIDTITETIAAVYVARPELVDTFYETVRRLAIYYNAKVMYENQLKGLKTYFQSRNSTGLLALVPRHLEQANGIKVNFNRKYGVTATPKINAHARERIRAWLLRERVVNDEGDVERNIDNILDVGLLEELIDWNDKGNFDRVSAMGMTMLLLDEYTTVESSRTYSAENKFLKTGFWKNSLRSSQSTYYAIRDSFPKGLEPL